MLYFLKLGGSLITHKDQPFSAQFDVIERLGSEIKSALDNDPQLHLVIGHGSGSFGHIAAKKFNTRNGVQTNIQWEGFLEVWRAARDLNNIVIQIFTEKKIPVITFTPSSSVISTKKRVSQWSIAPILCALNNNLIPVVYGDVVFDAEIGGSILSTEEIFLYLSHELQPNKILIAGMEKGVWADYPNRSKLLSSILANSDTSLEGLEGSQSPDVTGGMVEKVRILSELVITNPSCDAMVFSGIEPGNVFNALKGDKLGTIIHV
mgnify:CR=1 FL=1